MATVTLAAVMLAACGGGSGAKSTGPAATKVKFDPANFVDPTTSTNPYQPLRPGVQWVRGGTTEVGSRKVPYQVVSTMTDVIRMIDGVPTIAMLDQSTDAGEITQVGMDYYALDKDGNVWIFGGYTEDYEGGVYTNAADAFLGAASGAEPGILMPGKVEATTPRWFINAHGSEVSVAEPVEVGTSVCVVFGCYDHLRVIREGAAGAIDNEFKSYAPGIGVVKNAPKSASLHQDTFDLMNVVNLSADGLAEFSKIVLDLEEHARTTAPKVFGAAPKAERHA